MNKILEMLTAQGWTEVLVQEDIITGIKDQITCRCKILLEDADISDDFNFWIIPYEEDYLIYEAKPWIASVINTNLSQ